MNKISTNPFVGIRPFESSESLLFFGRQDQTMELLQRLHQYHFVAVTGGSGSGKSSLIKAGLIPSLKAGYLVNDRDRWMIASMKPGQSPLSHLADALLEQLDGAVDAEASKALVADIKERGSEVVQNLLEPLWNKNTNFFLLVDQFEELFRFSMEGDDLEKKNEAVEFVNILLALAAQKELPIYIVITMRSDFVGDCSSFYGLPEAMNQSQFIVPRLNRMQLKSTIEGPVKLYKGVINPSLTARLLNDVQLVKDELPLMQHALMRIWDYEMNVDKSGELDLADYEKVGGIEKALSNHADEALAGMTDNELSITKKIFQSLTVVDDKGRKVRRPVRLSELEEITGENRTVLLPIINRFIEDNRNFLILSKLDHGDQLIDIAHESLIRQWKTLDSWVEEEAESGKTFLRLTESAALYGKQKKDLLIGNELLPILTWYETFKPGKIWAKRYSADYENGFAYLQESEAAYKRAEARKKRRRKNGFALLYSAIALAFLLLGWFWLRENQQKNLAFTKQKLAEASEHAALMAKDSLERSLDSVNQRGRKVKNHYDTLYNTLRENLIDSFSLHDSLYNQNVITKTTIKYIDTSAENEKQRTAQRLANEYAAIQLMQRALKEVDKNPTVALRIAEAALVKNGYRNNAVYYMATKMYRENAFYKTMHNYGECPMLHAVSPDGSTILTIVNGKGKLLNTTTGEVAEFNGIDKKIYSIAFSPDGKLLAGGSDDGTTAIWDKSGTIEASLAVENDSSVIRSVSFSPDGNFVLVASDMGTVSLFNTKGTLIRTLPAKKHSVSSTTFSPDGKKIFINYVTGAPELWTVDGKLLQTWPSAQGKIYSVAFSQDGSRLATGYKNGVIKMWDANGFLMQEFREKNNAAAITSIVFSNDGTNLLAASQNGTAKLWHVNGYVIREFRGEMNSLLTAAFSPDEKKVYTGSLDGTVRLWDVSGTFNKYNGDYSPAQELTTFLEGDKMLDQLTQAQKKKFGID